MEHASQLRAMKDVPDFHGSFSITVKLVSIFMSVKDQWAQVLLALSKENILLIQLVQEYSSSLIFVLTCSLELSINIAILVLEVALVKMNLGNLMAKVTKRIPLAVKACLIKVKEVDSLVPWEVRALSSIHLNRILVLTCRDLTTFTVAMTHLT